jgi:hypothetical protein
MKSALPALSCLILAACMTSPDPRSAVPVTGSLEEAVDCVAWLSLAERRDPAGSRADPVRRLTSRSEWMFAATRRAGLFTDPVRMTLRRLTERADAADAIVEPAAAACAARTPPESA